MLYSNQQHESESNSALLGETPEIYHGSIVDAMFSTKPVPQTPALEANLFAATSFPEISL
jgi:hypothetical protein